MSCFSLGWGSAPCIVEWVVAEVEQREDADLIL